MTDGETIANTTRAQLGGAKFAAMTGAKNFTFDSEGTLTFHIGAGAKCGGKAVNFVKVAYMEGLDLYMMAFCYVRGGKVTARNVVSGVYADQLQTVFTANTGFYTTL